jgi:hypothetical protein
MNLKPARVGVSGDGAGNTAPHEFLQHVVRLQRMRSSGCPEVRIMGRSGQRSFTSRAKSMPSMTPRSRTSAKIMATSRPPISIAASAASALSHYTLTGFLGGVQQYSVSGAESPHPFPGGFDTVINSNAALIDDLRIAVEILGRYLLWRWHQPAEKQTRVTCAPRPPPRSYLLSPISRRLRDGPRFTGQSAGRRIPQIEFASKPLPNHHRKLANLITSARPITPSRPMSWEFFTDN